MDWNVYLSGEVHTDWRQELIDGVKARNLPIEFTSAVTDHQASDAAGDLLGAEASNFWRDHKSSKVNGIRTRTLIENVMWQSYVSGINTNSGMRPLTLGIVRLLESLISPSTMRASFIR